MKTSSEDEDERRLQDVFKMSSSRQMFAGINLQLNKKDPVIFHNLRGYDSHLIFSELDKLDVKITVIPNGLEKYMAFFE